MVVENRYTLAFGDISVRGRNNSSNAGNGPTISIYVGDREALTMDFFPNSPQGRHYHEKRYSEKDPIATIKLRNVPNDGTLLEHVVEHLAERLQSAGELLAAEKLTPANSHEIARFIAATYYELNRENRN